GRPLKPGNGEATTGVSGRWDPLVVVCALTFLHHVGAQMRGPVLPLYAASHGATETGVGGIVAAHMVVLGCRLIAPSGVRGALAGPRATFADVRANLVVWAGWIVSACGLVTQAVVYTFFPLLGDRRGLSPAGIG